MLGTTAIECVKELNKIQRNEQNTVWAWPQLFGDNIACVSQEEGEGSDKAAN